MMKQKLPIVAVTDDAPKRIMIPSANWASNDRCRRICAGHDLIEKTSMSYNTFYVPVRCRWKLFDRDRLVPAHLRSKAVRAVVSLTPDVPELSALSEQSELKTLTYDLTPTEPQYILNHKDDNTEQNGHDRHFFSKFAQIHPTMDNRLEIYCKNLGRNVECEGGETLLSLGQRLAGELGFTPISAHVNNRNQALAYKLYNTKQVDFQPMTSSSGTRVYVRSLCMMLYRALETLRPGAKIRIEHSISNGYYCRLTGTETSDALIAELRDEMRRLVGRDLPLVRDERLTSEVIEIFKRQGLDDKVILLETTRQLYTTYYTLDGLSDSYYGPLAPSTGYLKVFDLLPYKEGFLLMGFDPKNTDTTPPTVTQEKMYKAFTDYLAFDRIVGVSNVGGLNKVVEQHKAPELIYLAEALHEKALARISDEITRRYREGGARIVLIAGPSSSGKTTTTKRLGVQLMTNLLKPQLISLDNYFVDRTRTPRDESGDYDYESLYALDLEQFNADLNAIIRGEEVELPTYNFELGTRQYKGDKVKLDEGSLLLIEGIHGLNPELTAHIADKMKFRIYVSALTTVSIDDHNWIPSTDNRLLRRIIRDAKYRGTRPEETIRRWASVRRGEEKWIFPYQENADATFNSSLLFELGVMKDQAETLLSNVPNDVTEYAEAYRLRKFLSYFLPIPSHSVPSTSVIREFLGGSSFKY